MVWVCDAKRGGEIFEGRRNSDANGRERRLMWYGYVMQREVMGSLREGGTVMQMDRRREEDLREDGWTG